MDTIANVHVTLPAETHVFATIGGAASSGMDIAAAGTGSFTGMSYDVPAHATGTLKAKINVMSLTSSDIADLDKLVMSMLKASEKDKVTTHSKTTASADLSFWDLLLGGGASASTTQTRDTMNSMGLTDKQVTTIIEKLFDLASNMNHVELDFTIDNTANDYSVSGDFELYTISGEVTTSKGTRQYRMLANKGSAGSSGEQAPAKGKVIPLS